MIFVFLNPLIILPTCSMNPETAVTMHFPYGNFVRSYKNLLRNMVSYKIQSFLIRLKILVK